MSPDTVSSLFPDRPIRPLPKRRLRETLSPEIAESIKYPPSTQDNGPLFYYPPYTVRDESSPPSIGSLSPRESSRRGEPGPSTVSQRNGVRASHHDDVDTRSTVVTRPAPEILTRSSRRLSRLEQSRNHEPPPPPPPLSTASSVDGYDSFENTNNKKKRKIPSAGDTALIASHALNGDIASLASAGRAHSPPDDTSGDRSYPHPTAYSGAGSFISNSQGISGSGRGRLGRSGNGRSPLRALPDGSNSWAGRTTKASTAPQWAHPDQESSGIISSAIANAGKLPPQGQENVSLLQQHSTAKTTPASTQFTFTCDSQVPGTIQWPGHLSRNSISTQTAPGGSPGGHGNSSANHDGSSKAPSRGSAHSRRKARRRLERELALGARHRRQLAAEAYYHNPPKPEDVWICEFCEYERIFGEPPSALIRKYELRDRQTRHGEAERKRLLEKAKAKSRKSKKAGKTSGKGATAGSHVADQPHAEHIEDEEAPHMQQGRSHSTQSEEDYEDEFDDDYSNPPPDIPVDIAAEEGTPALLRGTT